MAIFAGVERLTFLDIQRESGSVTSLVKAAEKYIVKNIRWRVVFDGSLQRNEIPEIPIDAVREAIINSFCHRDYKSSQNNEITIHSNRIEIYNPGTFPDGLTPNDFIEGASRSIKRNPLLAQLLYYTKDIESFGTGLKRITDECDAAGIKVEFKMMKLGFAVVFYRPDIFIPDGKNGDSIGDGDITINITNNITINDAQKKILAQMQTNPKITTKDLAKTLGIADRNVKNHIKTLKEVGLIERIGSPKNGHWIVKQNGDTQGRKEKV